MHLIMFHCRKEGALIALLDSIVGLIGGSGIRCSLPGFILEVFPSCRQYLDYSLP
jgi:hypothetical protein